MDIIQLRDKGSTGEHQLGPLEARDELAALEILADAARRHGALLAVNDRADIARAAGADVLHLGQDDLPLAVARDDRRAGHADRPVRARSRSGGRGDRRGRRLLLRRAVLADPDQTGTPGAGPGAGAYCRRSGARQTVVRDRRYRHADRLPEVLEAGARRIVVVRAITGARRSAGRGRAAQFGACSSELIRELSCDGAWSGGPRCTTRKPLPRSRPCAAGAPPLVAGAQRHDRRRGAQPLPTGGESRVQRQFGHLVFADPAHFGALVVGHGVQQFSRVGDDGGVGPVRAARVGGDHGSPHRKLLAGQTGLLMGFPDGSLLGGLVAVAGTARQTPRSALMAPRRPVLQQHRRSAVGQGRPEQQAGRAVPAPVMHAGVGHHPSVTVAAHAFRISSARRRCGRVAGR